MRVAVYHRNDDVRLEERPEPAIGPGELLVRVEASGICGSDVMEWYRVPRAPLILGHEVTGVVEQAGPGVTDFKIGDRVVSTHHVPCNDCHLCRTDRHAVCEMLRTTSFDPGGFSELLRLPAVNVERGTFLLPDDVDFAEGSFVEPLACVVRSQRLAGLCLGDSVAVLGSGISGILQIQYVKAAGASRVFATDVSDYRLDAARRFGADLALDASDDVADEVRAANDGRGVNQVVVCTGADSALSLAFDLVADGGTVLCFAPLSPGQTMALPMNELWRRGISIVNSYAGPPADMRAALDLIQSRRIDVASMVTHRLPLARTQEGFGLMSTPGESLKIIVEPQL
jgi:L-iditol 2-dehydrogenase